ncbi:hypothetical protein Bp8pS_211 [Bacillus phage vB_BpuM-BpSp]|nr:hypothetical protein Bp8pS_211 [Bacillus phage vB_BpuM-BpSp]
MGFLKKLFGKKTKKDEEIELLKDIIESNTQIMKNMDKKINLLEESIENEVASSIENETKEKKKLIETEQEISHFISNYLSYFKLDRNGKFYITENYDLIKDFDDLLFIIIQMVKIGESKTEYEGTYKGNSIKLKIFNTTGDPEVWYSLNSSPMISKETVGITFLKKFINDIKEDIVNFPSVTTHSLFEVKGREYSYILANNERSCYYILGDKNKETPIKRVKRVRGKCYIKSIRSSLIYRMK